MNTAYMPGARIGTAPEPALVRLLVAAGLALGLTGLGAPRAHAQTAPSLSGGPLAAGRHAALPSDQPFASAWFPNTLLTWSPASDPDAPYNRAAVPLRPRFTVPGLQANDHARLGEARVNPLSAFAPTSNNPSQGSLDVDYYTFGYWPYVDVLVFWGGSAGEGLILAPNPGVTDAAHRHGVEVLGTVFFPPRVFGGQIQWVRDFVQRDGDTFPVADKLIEAAEHYGFDGWFINQETEGGDAALAQDLQEMMVYLQERSDLRVEWYDAMTESGAIAWQEQLNPLNDAFFQQDSSLVSDYMFLDFGWTASDLQASNAYAQSLGRDPYDLYAGADYQALGIGIGGSFPALFPEGQPHRLSLGIYRPDETFSPDLAAFYARERELWVGADGDPSRPDAGSWKGIAHYVPAATSIDRMPFVTHFGPGQGYGYYVGGENLAPATWAGVGWNNLSLQDVQPTWRWWVETAGAPVTVDYDFETAYDGGASIRLAGDVAADQHVRLFQTDIELTGSTRLDIAYRVAGAGPVALDVGLIFASDPGGVTRLDLGPAAQAAWNLETLDLSAYAGQTLAGLSLYVPASAGAGFEVHVGRLGVYEPASAPGAPTNVAVERRTDENAEEITLRLRWAAPAGEVHHYEVYRRLPDDARQFLGGTSTTAYFVPSLLRVEGQATIPIEVVAVGPTGERSVPGTTSVPTFEPPTAAASPSPADGAADVPLDARLTWAPGTGATSRTLHFGTVNPPPPLAQLTGTVYDPGTLDPNTAYYWRVDETNAAGTTRGPLWSFTTGTRPGTGAAALTFEGDDFVDLGDGEAVGVTGSAITLEARVNPSRWRDEAYEGSVLNKEQNGPDNGYAIRVGASGTVNFLLGANGWREVSSPSGALVLDAWQHVAATYDGAVMRVYVDGEEVASRSASFAIADALADLYVGSSQRNPTRTFPGGIDEVRVWAVARSAEALRATMDAELDEAYYATADSGLVGYWRFNEGSGQMVIDETAPASHGTLGVSAASGPDDPTWTPLAPVGMGDGGSGVPPPYALGQNYPNPFARATTIRFALSHTGPVRLALYDVLGRRIALLVDEVRPAGTHTVRLDASRLPSGAYVYRLEAGDAYRASRRLLLIR